MNVNSSAFKAWQPHVLAVLRIVTGYLFLLHGSAKLFQMPHIAGMDGVQLMSLIGLSAVIELVCGVLVLIGWFTRPAAFLASGEMAFAYFMGHASKGNPLFPLANQGDAAVLYCFIFLYLSVAGAGAWSVDSRR